MYAVNAARTIIVEGGIEAIQCALAKYRKNTELVSQVIPTLIMCGLGPEALGESFFTAISQDQKKKQ